jgi:hypothetical protein
MLQAFVFENVAVLVFPWHEAGEPPERGTRVEVRLLEHQPPRGSKFAAQRFVIDHPVFRADLFDKVNAPPGNLRSAHFHPNFDGVEPSDRFWRDEVKKDPAGWLATELSDLGKILERGGVETSGVGWVEGDAAAVRDAIPAIVAAVEATWESVRSVPV